MPDQDHRPRLPVQRRDQGVLVVGEGDAGAADRAAVSGEGDGLGGEAGLGEGGDHAVPCRADMEGAVQQQKTRDVGYGEAAACFTRGEGTWWNGREYIRRPRGEGAGNG